MVLSFNIDDVTGYVFMNEKYLEERKTDNGGEGTILEAVYLRNGIGSVYRKGLIFGAGANGTEKKPGCLMM